MLEYEMNGVEADGLIAFEDLSMLSDAEVQHRIIDGFITLAHRNGRSIEDEIKSCSASYGMLCALRGL